MIRDSQPNFSSYGNSTDEDDLPRSSLARTLRKPVTELSEFGLPQSDVIRRSATIGDISDHRDGFDRDRKARTAGYRTKPRPSLPNSALSDEGETLRERSATSMYLHIPVVSHLQTLQHIQDPEFQKIDEVKG